MNYLKYGVLQRIEVDSKIIDFTASNYVRIGNSIDVDENGCLTSFKIYNLDRRVNTVYKEIIQTTSAEPAKG